MLAELAPHYNAHRGQCYRCQPHAGATGFSGMSVASSAACRGFYSTLPSRRCSRITAVHAPAIATTQLAGKECHDIARRHGPSRGRVAWRRIGLYTRAASHLASDSGDYSEVFARHFIQP
jgi:hypothetical protein